MSVLKLQCANKNKAEAYLLYVEHLFLCSNAVDGVHIFKSYRRAIVCSTSIAEIRDASFENC